MAKTVRHPRPRATPRAATRRNRQAVWLTSALLVVVGAYCAAFGSDGWLWFGWAVLLLVCLGLFAIRP
ncbi:hypothetical protein [Kitasatospora sp. NPDC088351]|uniref:hypothetical protein n=1 Tax=unclassified Kitasatospora TaxID=2633591 RepID=UPI00342AA6A7